MSNFRHSRPAPRHAAPSATSGYVSDFARFMDAYLQSHPEVEADQHIGWDIYWDKKVDFAALDEEKDDTVSAERFFSFGSPHFEKWPPGSK